MVRVCVRLCMTRVYIRIGPTATVADRVAVTGRVRAKARSVFYKQMNPSDLTQGFG